jgi:diacylglycerol kinase (ATP)
MRYLVVINPISGKEYPVLSVINKAFHQEKSDWDAIITKPKTNLKDLFPPRFTKKYQACVVYGGDGTVGEVAQILEGTNLPLYPLYGGTGNTFARELNIKPDVSEALSALLENQLKLIQVDTARVNKKFFMMATLIGRLGRMNQQTTREFKQKMGLWAYAYTFYNLKPVRTINTYKVTIDGRRRTLIGTGLLILNSRFQGIGDFKISSRPGLSTGTLTLVVIPPIDPANIATGLVNLLKDKSLDDLVKSYSAKRILIKTAKPTTVLADETTFTTQRIQAYVKPKSLAVLAPAGT